MKNIYGEEIKLTLSEKIAKRILEYSLKKTLKYLDRNFETDFYGLYQFCKKLEVFK